MKSTVEFIHRIKKILEKKYPSFMDSKFVEEKEEWGCVVRAFSYAVGEEATDREYALRLKQVRQGRQRLKLFQEDKQKVIEGDDKAWMKLIRRITMTKSPFGSALSNFDIVEASLTVKAINRALKRGEKIIVYKDSHISCVDVGYLDILRHVSDRNKPPMCYDIHKPIKVFRIIKKK